MAPNAESGPKGGVETVWISWEEASRRTGIRVPTIEHAVRVGRIARRPRHGTRPTLDASSVDAWAADYRRQREDLEERRRAAKVYWPLRRREDGWLTTRETSAVLGLSASTVRRLAHRGVLAAEGEGWLWFDAASVEAYRAEEARWISWEQAAALLGATRHEVHQLVAQHQLAVRPATGSQRSVLAASVIAYLPAWRATRATRSVAQRERAERRAWSAPPDDRQDWIGVDQAAELLGLSPSGVRLRLNADRLPGVRRRHWWMRRADIERAARAERFSASRLPHSRDDA